MSVGRGRKRDKRKIVELSIKEATKPTGLFFRFAYADGRESVRPSVPYVCPYITPSVRSRSALFYPLRLLSLTCASRACDSRKRESGRLYVAFTVIPLPRGDRRDANSRSSSPVVVLLTFRRIDHAGIKGNPKRSLLSEGKASYRVSQRPSQRQRLAEIAIRNSPFTLSFFIS